MAYQPSLYQLAVQRLSKAFNALRGRDSMASDRTTAIGYINDPTMDQQNKLYSEPLEQDALNEEIQNLLNDHPWLDAAIEKLCDISEFSITVKSAVNGQVELAKGTRILNRTKEDCQLEQELPRIACRSTAFGNGFIEVISSQENPKQIVDIQLLPNTGMVRNTDIRDQFIKSEPCFYQRSISNSSVENARKFYKGQLLHVRYKREGRYGKGIFFAGRAVAKDSLQVLRMILARRLANMPFRVLNVAPGKGIVFTLFQKIKDNLSRLLYIQRGNQITPFDQLVVNDVDVKYFSGDDAKAGDLKDLEILLDSLLCLIGISRQILGAGTNVNRDVMDEQREEAFKNRKKIINCLKQQFLKPLFDLALALEDITPTNIEYTIDFPDLVTDSRAERRCKEARELAKVGLLDIVDAFPVFATFLGIIDIKGGTERAEALKAKPELTSPIPISEPKQITEEQQKVLSFRSNILEEDTNMDSDLAA
jgi:hypothetical protein